MLDNKPTKLNMHTMPVVDSNIEKIGRLFPACITERKNALGALEKAIDFDLLRQELANSIVEGPQERYSFSWPGKRASIRTANSTSNMTLRPCREESVNFDSTENLYIEGDNLEVLKLLRENYMGRIKMIYIDPPYNTGNDFIYKDSFQETSYEYKGRSGAYDEDGNAILTGYDINTSNNGRFHTDWLNMIFPRIKVAKDLLREDGVLIVSISDDEFDNLKKVCDEIFGASNYLGDILWNSTKSVTNTALISVSHTYNLVYFKSLSYFVEHRSEFRLPDDGEGFENPDNDPRGPWKADPFQVGGWRPNQQYSIVNPKTGETYRPNPGCSWKNDFETFKKLIADNRIVFGRTGEGGPQRKRFIWEAQERGRVAKTWWDDVETTTNGTQLVKKMFGGVTVFTNPKPVGFIKKLLQLGCNDGIVLDFFAGSSTTAHAVMELNAADGGTRKYILIQIPELVDSNSEAYKAGFKSICEIGKERIRRAGKTILSEKEANTENGELFPAATKEKPRLDIGFRVLKLDSSNMEDVYYKPEDSSEATLFEDNVKPDRSGEDLLFQVMLECNLPLSAKIQTEKIAGKEVFSVNNGYLIACFDEDVNEEVITAVAKRKPYYFIMRDKSLSSDNVADNFEQIFQAYSKETIRRII